MAHAYRLKARGSGEALELSYREFYNLQRLGGVAKPYMGEGTIPEIRLSFETVRSGPRRASFLLLKLVTILASSR